MQDNRDPQPMTPDRRFGVVLLILTLVGFTAMNFTQDHFWFHFWGVLGTLSLLSGVFLAAKSIDDGGGFTEQAYNFGNEDEGKSEEELEQDRELRAALCAPSPMDGLRKLAAVFLIACVAGFAVAANTAGWVQVVFMVVGLGSMLTAIALLGRSTDRHNAEVFRRFGRTGDKDDSTKKDEDKKS